MSEPTTEAGQMLLERFLGGFSSNGELVAAIETEAIATYRQDLRTRVEALPTWDKRTVPGGFHINRAAVLRLIAEGGTDERPA